jgi:DNA-binding transcriptional regulator YiaG
MQKFAEDFLHGREEFSIMPLEMKKYRCQTQVSQGMFASEIRAVVHTACSWEVGVMFLRIISIRVCRMSA